MVRKSELNWIDYNEELAAHHMMEWNGMDRMEWNGMENGMEWNGMDQICWNLIKQRLIQLVPAKFRKAEVYPNHPRHSYPQLSCTPG